MGRACNTYGVEERCVRVFGGEPEGRKHSEDPDLDWKIILKYIF
jgi:hypothetical protein